MTTMPELAQEVVALARRRGVWLAFAESITGGAISDAVVSVPGASEVFLGSVVAYSTELKRQLLGVTEQQLAVSGAVSKGVAEQMVLGVAGLVCDAVATQPRPLLALAITGVAGPTEQDGQPLGTVWVSVSLGLELRSHQLHLSGDRAAVRSAAVRAALELIREVLQGNAG